MNSNQVITYIKSGLTERANSIFFRRIALGPVLLATLFELLPGLILGGFWLVLALISLGSVLVAAVIVIAWSKKEKTLLNQLKMQGLSYSSWVLQFLSMQVFFYTLAHGFDYVIILICSAPFLTVFFVGVRNARRLQSEKMKTYKADLRDYSSSFLWTGLVGVGLAKVFWGEVTQQKAIALLILLLSFLSCIFSFGLLTFQKIYYLKRLGKDFVIDN